MWLRLTIKKLRNSTSICQLSELYLYDSLNNRVSFPSGTTITAPNASYYSSEGPDKIIDNNTNTKFCCTNFSNFTSTGLVILFELPSDIIFSKYSYVTANDSSERDPITWTLEKSNDNIEWELLSSIENFVIPTSRRVETQLWSLISEQGKIGDNALLFTKEQINLSNWTKNMNSFPQFENNFDGIKNTIAYTGGSGYEKIYTKVAVEKNKIYELHINFCSPSGFSFGGYDSVNKEQIFVMDRVPSGDCYTTLSGIIAYSDNIDNSASNELKDYIINFNSGNNTEVYIVIDFGQITDGISVNFIYSILLSLYDKKYLVYDDVTKKYYNIVNNTLNELDIEEVTSDIFKTYGNDIVPLSNLLIILQKPKILYWQDSNDDLPLLKANITAVPLPQTIITTDIDISDSSITGIEKVSGEYAGNPVIAVSFDNGKSWKSYNEQWTLLSDSTTGMSMETLAAIPAESWNEQIKGLTSFKMRFTLTAADDVVTNVIIDFMN